MSNFTCPTCGLTNIDCGKAGYKTDREIELEKKLEIAVKALEHYANENSWVDCRKTYNDNIYREALFFSQGYKAAQKALAKIKEIKG